MSLPTISVMHSQNKDLFQPRRCRRGNSKRTLPEEWCRGWGPGETAFLHRLSQLQMGNYTQLLPLSTPIPRLSFSINMLDNRNPAQLLHLPGGLNTGKNAQAWATEWPRGYSYTSKVNAIVCKEMYF